MLIYEVSKKAMNEECNGDLMEAIKQGWYVAYDEERIRKAHNFGHGTMADMKRYMKNNKAYCIFYDAENCVRL